MKTSIKMKNNLVLEILNSFITYFSDSTLEDGCVMSPNRILGIVGEDHVTKINEDTGLEFQATDIYQAIEILKQANILTFEIHTLYGDVLKLKIPGSSLVLIVAPIRFTPGEKNETD